MNPFSNSSQVPVDRRFPHCRHAGALICVVLSAFNLALAAINAQEITQEFSLRPGWNAVFLQVEPQNNQASTVFAQLPVESVWTRSERLSSADFIQDQNEAKWNEPGWLVYIPPGRPESFLSTLHAVHVNRPYLIKIQGNQTVVWRITGRPSLNFERWTPDAFNLRGFPVAENPAPTFRSYFQNAPAHFNQAANQLEEIYHLGSDGIWQRVLGGALMQPGEAYWVYCRGKSDFVAPLELELDQEDGLIYDALLAELTMRFRTRSSTPGSVTIRSVAEGIQPLVHWNFDTATGRINWLPLIELDPFQVAPGHTERLRIAVQRRTFVSATYRNVLEITDDAGSRYWVPVSAEKSAASISALQSNAPASPNAGLWVGAIRIHGVSEAHSNNPAAPTPTRSDFQIRLIIHVDGNGRARLLKEVIQMWKDGTYQSDPSGNLVQDQPGEFVLLTDETLVPQFKGVAVRDGVPVGRRFSTVGFDFDGGQDNALELDGEFEIGQTLTGTILLDPDFPTNPFRHRFHPDHDNLDARYAQFNPEAYEIRRELEFRFTEEDPTGFSTPDYGYSVMAGHFRETISGLHHQPIHVQGEFRLRRIADTAALNPAPATN